MKKLNTILEPLLDALGRQRHKLIIIYLIMLGFYCLAVASINGDGGPISGLQYLIPNEEQLASSESMPVVIFLTGMLMIQGLFLWGGGKLSVDSLPAGPWRLLIPVTLAAAFMALLSVGLLMTVLEMVDRFEGQGSVREISVQTSDNLEYFKDDFGPFIFLVPMWILWIAIGMYKLRNSDSKTALSRLTGTLLAGSWIEFLVALPVDIAIRQRAEDCPCSTGSWFALVFAIPIFLFAFGPGIILLYLRELQLAKVQPKRAWKILLRKTRRTAENIS